MVRKLIAENTAFKLLIEPQGAIFALRMHVHSYLFFVIRGFVGVKKVRTNDFIVARAGYSAPRTLELIRELYPTGT
jgi:hypothetical protein